MANTQLREHHQKDPYDVTYERRWIRRAAPASARKTGLTSPAFVNPTPGIIPLIPVGFIPEVDQLRVLNKPGK